MKPFTEKQLALFRRHMVEIIDMHFDLASEELGRDAVAPNLRRALLAVPRHLFVAPQLMSVAYQDTPLPIGFDKTISQPFMAAAMIDLLDLEPEAAVLEVGTGLGYQAAVMAEMGAQVRSVEVVEEFAEAAGLRLVALGYDVPIRIGDGSRGWAEHAPFDRILVTAAAIEPPPALIAQLKPGGRMVLPLGKEGDQRLSLVEKNGEGLTTRSVMAVAFTMLETVV